MRMLLPCLIVSVVAGCHPCDAEGEPFDVSEDLTAADIDEILDTYTSADAPDQIDCEMACQQVVGASVDAASCTHSIDVPEGAAPADVVGSVACDGETVVLCL